MRKGWNKVGGGNERGAMADVPSELDRRSGKIQEDEMVDDRWRERDVCISKLRNAQVFPFHPTYTTQERQERGTGSSV